MAWPKASIRLERKIERVPISGCWIYTGFLDPEGYGKFMEAGKQLRAHRYSYTLHKGNIPEGLFVCHTCDVPCCVNPDHLWLGTHDDNMKDKVKKGRSNGNRPLKEKYNKPPIGETQNSSSL